MEEIAQLTTQLINFRTAFTDCSDFNANNRPRYTFKMILEVQIIAYMTQI